MATKKKTHMIAELDAICDEFERAVALNRDASHGESRKGDLGNLDPWLLRVEPALRPWLRRELITLYRELTSSSSIKATRSDDDGPIAVDPMIWRAIKRNQTFRPLSVDAKGSLAKGIRPRIFAAGATILQAGQRAEGLCLILEGQVEIVARDGDTRTTLDVDGPGSILGEISTITGEPCTADVIAVTTVDALVLPADTFDAIRSRHPEVEIALSQLVSDRLGQRQRDALCGKSLGGYRLDRCISSGAMGVVYRAANESDGTFHALKMLRHRFIYHPRVVSRFEQEAELLRNLHHPNIVSMRDHFVAYKTRFIVLDLYNGLDLRRLLRDQGPVNEETARGVLGQIADGLRHAHECGVLHLDLKPANILINHQGHIAITDFGLSKLIESDGCDVEAVGTPLYMPPEQFTMTDVGTHSDWYALGCIAYELITGKPLFSRDDRTGELSDLKQHEPDTHWPSLNASDEYRSLVAGAIQPSITKRAMNLDTIAAWGRDVSELVEHIGLTEEEANGSLQ